MTGKRDVQGVGESPGGHAKELDKLKTSLTESLIGMIGTTVSCDEFQLMMKEIIRDVVEEEINKLSISVTAYYNRELYGPSVTLSYDGEQVSTDYCTL